MRLTASYLLISGILLSTGVDPAKASVRQLAENIDDAAKKKTNAKESSPAGGLHEIGEGDDISLLKPDDEVYWERFLQNTDLHDERAGAGATLENVAKASKASKGGSEDLCASTTLNECIMERDVINYPACMWCSDECMAVKAKDFDPDLCYTSNFVSPDLPSSEPSEPPSDMPSSEPTPLPKCSDFKDGATNTTCVNPDTLTCSDVKVNETNATCVEPPEPTPAPTPDPTPSPTPAPTPPPIPEIRIETYINGVDIDEPTSGPCMLMESDSTATWYYFVENVGGVDLHNVTVTDTGLCLTENITTCLDLSPSCPLTTLAPEESMICTEAVSASSLAGFGAGRTNLTNTGTATGSIVGTTVTDSDPSFQCFDIVPTPSRRRRSSGPAAPQPNTSPTPVVPTFSRRRRSSGPAAPQPETSPTPV